MPLCTTGLGAACLTVCPVVLTAAYATSPGWHGLGRGVWPIICAGWAGPGLCQVEGRRCWERWQCAPPCRSPSLCGVGTRLSHCAASRWAAALSRLGKQQQGMCGGGVRDCLQIWVGWVVEQGLWRGCSEFGWHMPPPHALLPLIQLG